jgi:hypothetical protein
VPDLNALWLFRIGYHSGQPDAADEGRKIFQRNTRSYVVTLSQLLFLRIWFICLVIIVSSGLRGLEVTFPPYDPSDAGSIPAEVVEFFTEKFGNKVLRKGL